MNINKLPDDLIYYIYEYLLNEDIFKMNIIDKKHHNLINKEHFKEFLLYRDHPLIFNVLHNLCGACNLSLIILNDCEFAFCSHYYSLKRNN